MNNETKAFVIRTVRRMRKQGRPAAGLGGVCENIMPDGRRCGIGIHFTAASCRKFSNHTLCLKLALDGVDAGVVEAAREAHDEAANAKSEMSFVAVFEAEYRWRIENLGFSWPAELGVGK